MSTEAQLAEGTATGERRTNEIGSDTNSSTEQQRPSYPETSYLCLRINEPEKTNAQEERKKTPFIFQRDSMVIFLSNF